MAFSVDLNQICFHDLGKLIIYVKLICLCKYFSYKGCSQLETITENPIFDGIIWNDAKITEKYCILKINLVFKGLLNELHMLIWL